MNCFFSLFPIVENEAIKMRKYILSNFKQVDFLNILPGGELVDQSAIGKD